MQKSCPFKLLYWIYQLIKVEFATENDNNYIKCMTPEEAINKVRTLKLVKYLNPSYLYAF